MPSNTASKTKASLIALFGALAFLPCAPASALSAADIVGTWKIISYVHKDAAGETSLPMGQHPSGYLIVGADRRCTVIVAAEGRKAARSEEGFAELAKTMIAYSAPFREEADGEALKVTLRPDVSWNQSMTGASLVRFISMEDGKLVVRSAAGPHGGAMAKFERAD